MDEEKDDCAKDNYLTTYMVNFQPYKGIYLQKKEEKKSQPDPMLLTGHFQNNLLVNGRIMKSKLWKESEFGIEEYNSFVSKLEQCKKTIYELFFKQPNIRLDIIEDMLKNLERTVYQSSYSPGVYVPISEGKRILLDPVSANMKYHETTYRTYYNRIEELERFKKYMVGKICKTDRAELKQQLQNIYKCGRSTYYDTICLPVYAMAKHKPMLESPIDVHTWRRV